MAQNRTGFVIRNLIFSLINNFVGTILPFVVRTVTIHYLGSEYMGLNNLCVSILNVLNVAELGISNAFAYRLYKPMAYGEKEEICRLLNYYRKVYIAIGSIILGAGLVLMPFLKCFITGETPQNTNIYLVFLLYLVSSAGSYIFYAYKDLLFTADQRLDYKYIISAITYLFLYISQIYLIWKRNYYLSVIMLPVSTILSNIVKHMISCKKYPEYKCRGEVSKEFKQNLQKDVFSVAIFKIRDISRNAFDSVVISAFVGLVVLSNYQNYYMVFTVPALLLGIMQATVSPSVGNCILTEKKDKVYSVYQKIVFIQEFVTIWFAICYGYLIQDFVTIWLGKDFLMSGQLVLLLVVYLYLLGQNYITQVIREAAGLWNYGRGLSLLEMLVNLALNPILAMQFGVEGVVLSTVISLLFISIPRENFIVYKYFFKGNFAQRGKSFLVNIAWGIITACLVGFLCYLEPDQLLVGFLYKTVICILVPPIMLMLFFYRTEEFGYIIQVVKKIIKK